MILNLDTHKYLVILAQYRRSEKFPVAKLRCSLVDFRCSNHLLVTSQATCSYL